jgi:hypothetical protein
MYQKKTAVILNAFPSCPVNAEMRAFGRALNTMSGSLRQISWRNNRRRSSRKNSANARKQKALSQSCGKTTVFLK